MCLNAPSLPAPLQLGFTLCVYPCLTLTYLGQAALSLQRPEAAAKVYWESIPTSLTWPMASWPAGAATQRRPWQRQPCDGFLPSEQDAPALLTCQACRDALPALCPLPPAVLLCSWCWPRWPPSLPARPSSPAPSLSHSRQAAGPLLPVHWASLQAQQTSPCVPSASAAAVCMLLQTRALACLAWGCPLPAGLQATLLPTHHHQAHQQPHPRPGKAQPSQPSPAPPAAPRQAAVGAVGRAPGSDLHGPRLAAIGWVWPGTPTGVHSTLQARSAMFVALHTVAQTLVPRPRHVRASFIHAGLHP